MANQKKLFEVKWKIEKLMLWIVTRDDTLYSPQFLAETLANTRWKLTLSPNRHLGEKYISLALQRDVEDDHPDPIDLNYELSFLACDESNIKSKTFTKKFEPRNVSHELNVKQDEIFEKKEDYLPEGALTVSCKMWKTRASISKAGFCFVQSVIGAKSIIMQETVDVSLEYQTLYFISTSADISLISFDVYINYDFSAPNTMTFRTKHVKCKDFLLNDCKLFLFTASGKKKYYSGNSELNKLFESYKKWTFLGYNLCNIIRHSKHNELTFQLEITYIPGVTSEHIKYEYSACEKLSSSDQGIETLNTSDSENVHSNTSNDLQATHHEEKHWDTKESRSRYEKEYSDASRVGNVLSSTLKHDLTTLQGDQLFCDIKLRTDTETFPAHRCILSARSPVFKKMFTTDMKEKASESISVPDISSDTVRRMLQFLYTDCTGILEMQKAKDLYIASDKYDIASLKQCCSSFIKNNLRPSNVCEILVLADMHQDKDLESAAHEYVLNYDKEVLSSDEWKLFMQNYSTLAAQVMYLNCMKK